MMRPIRDMMLSVSPVRKSMPGHADERERQGEHDGEGIDEGLELGGEDQVDEDDGQDEGLDHVAEGLLHLFGLARRRRS